MAVTVRPAPASNSACRPAPRRHVQHPHVAAQHVQVVEQPAGWAIDRRRAEFARAPPCRHPASQIVDRTESGRREHPAPRGRCARRARSRRAMAGRPRGGWPAPPSRDRPAATGLPAGGPDGRVRPASGRRARSYRRRRARPRPRRRGRGARFGRGRRCQSRAASHVLALRSTPPVRASGAGRRCSLQQRIWRAGGSPNGGMLGHGPRLGEQGD